MAAGRDEQSRLNPCDGTHKLVAAIR